MSRLQEDTAQILNDIATDNIKSTIQCTSANLSVRNEKNKTSSSKLAKSAKQSHSDGNIIKSPENTGLKQKFVNKVKSWNSKDTKTLHCDVQPSLTSKAEANLLSDLEALNLSNENSEDNLCKPDWLRAKDSLENLLVVPTNDKATGTEVINSRSASLSPQEKPLADSPHSDPFLGASKPSPSNSVSKVLTWDPWDKLSRKSKKENKRRKLEKSPLQSRENSRQRTQDIESSRKDHMAGDEVRPKVEEQIPDPNDDIDQEEIYEYKPYIANNKAVNFTNEVMVVYFTGDEVINECIEPLKKELEQQIRNKEMRGKKRLPEDYMAAWIKTKKN